MWRGEELNLSHNNFFHLKLGYGANINPSDELIILWCLLLICYLEESFENHDCWRFESGGGLVQQKRVNYIWLC